MICSAALTEEISALCQIDSPCLHWSSWLSNWFPFQLQQLVLPDKKQTLAVLASCSVSYLPRWANSRWTSWIVGTTNTTNLDGPGRGGKVVICRMSMMATRVLPVPYSFHPIISSCIGPQAESRKQHTVSIRTTDTRRRVLVSWSSRNKQHHRKDALVLRDMACSNTSCWYRRGSNCAAILTQWRTQTPRESLQNMERSR